METHLNIPSQLKHLTGDSFKHSNKLVHVNTADCVDGIALYKKNVSSVYLKFYIPTVFAALYFKSIVLPRVLVSYLLQWRKTYGFHIH